MKSLPKTLKNILKTGKGKAILGASVAGVAGIAVAAAILLQKPESYRTISVEEVNGTSVVTNEQNESDQAYKGMHLYSGDDVDVQSASDMTLVLDMNKYVYAEENTHFWLKAEGSAEKSKTRIYLEEGGILNRIDTTLKDGEEYKVETPNSVMSVRGTVYRVSVYKDSYDITYTKLEVFQGAVYVELKTLDGGFNGVSEVFQAGETALIRAASDFSEFVVGENGSIKQEIDYKAIPQNTAKKLVSYIDAGEELCIGKELLMDYTQLAEHQMEEVITEEATCEHPGKKEIRCTVCDEVEEVVTIPQLSHEGEWIVVSEPDCTTPGTEEQICNVCGEVMDTRETEPLGHVPGEYEITRQATCTQEGQRVRRCTVCDEIVQRDTIAMLPHESSDWQITIQNTCTTDGEMVKTCIHCGLVLETSPIAATGHRYSDWIQTITPDCTNVGSQNRICIYCGDIQTMGLVALGHAYGGWVQISEPSCTGTGSLRRTCSHCGGTETMSIAALGHSFGGWTQISVPDCTNEGSQSRTCSRCGAEETTSIAALGHSFGAWEETRAATCTAEGSQSRTCTRCGAEETASIAKVDHVPAGIVEHGDFVDLSYDEKGMATVTVFDACDICGESITLTHTIKRTSIELDGEFRDSYFCIECNKYLPQ